MIGVQKGHACDIHGAQPIFIDYYITFFSFDFTHTYVRSISFEI